MNTVDPGKQSAELCLIHRGAARAAIVVHPQAPEKTAEAARALQKTIRKMSRVELALVKHEEEIRQLSEDTVQIAVGPAAASWYGVAVEQDYAIGDHYRIEAVQSPDSRQPALVLAGNDAGVLRGTNYAVYDWLQRLGCGWYGPSRLWQVIPRRQTITVPARLSIVERADFPLHRNIWLVPEELRDAWRLGGQTISPSHSLGSQVLARTTYAADHPEWFATGQVDLTHPGAIAQTAEELRSRINEAEFYPLNISIGAQDCGGFAVHRRSRAVGNISAQYLYFANQVARRLQTTHAGKFRLCFYGYWYTHEPPAPSSPAEPELLVWFVNQGNKSKSWEAPEADGFKSSLGSNLRQFRNFLGWVETGATIGIYEWWIPGCGNPAWREVPWYQGQASLDNLKIWRQHGVKLLSYESQRRDEIDDGFPIRWPLFYVGARGAWDASVRAGEVMREACTKLFAKAALPMLSYYQTLEQAMVDTPEAACNWNLPSPETVYTSEIRNRASRQLAQARALAESDLVRQRIEQEQKIWQRALVVMAELERTARQQKHLVIVDGKSLETDQPIVDEKIVRELLGVPDAAPLFAVEVDGQTRPTDHGEKYDLRSGLQFTTRDFNQQSEQEN